MDVATQNPAFRVVSLGGGTGQPALLRALRRTGYPLDIDAIVAMGDDGRSSGILREREGMLPPGDLRKCLTALAAEPEGSLARAFEHRFDYLNNHAMGNLMIAALVGEGDSFPAAIGCCAQLLGCVGNVLPSTLDPISLRGTTIAGEEVAGQAMLSYGSGRLDRIWLESAFKTTDQTPQEGTAAGSGSRAQQAATDPGSLAQQAVTDPGSRAKQVVADPSSLAQKAVAEPLAYEPAVRAILAADLIVMGPGSLFTSLLPNLLVPGIAEALAKTKARRLFICPKADVPGETEGMDAEAYIDALEQAGFLELLDTALFHRRDCKARPYFVMQDPRAERFLDVELTPAAEKRLSQRIPHIMVRDLADEHACTAHDTNELAAALREVMDTCPSAQR
ncbi:YvcK family protein [Collinsella sp. AGMB00827]|uniref:YvcK family protein n=1 Tax=Collinsella ureilytica TaxID=2869515 RepID=A0ABS7MI57_9ACTN|nr:gluconeogenesis factor YvcK family protein [Collinsella urealyticum]MBY4797043.1 YvcK family protein [Collinsella urealyticum]